MFSFIPSFQPPPPSLACYDADGVTDIKEEYGGDDVDSPHRRPQGTLLW